MLDYTPVLVPSTAPPAIPEASGKGKKRERQMRQAVNTAIIAATNPKGITQ